MATTNIPNPDPTPDQPKYWFWMVQDGNTKKLWAYCGLGYAVDYEEDDTGEKSWSDLMNAAIPAIQADIDQWGLP